MGMDVVGINATNEKGEYFRNNVWWWRPLATYIVDNHFNIASACENWHTNDGDGLDATASRNLARALKEDLEKGVVADYEREYNRQLANLDRETCHICNGTGIRSDELGKKMEQDTKELKPEIQILTGRSHGWCNGCDGIGSREHWGMSYPFSTENVAEFADFLEHCGGFQIC